MKKNKKESPHLNFSNVVTIIITLVVMVFTHESTSKTINWGTTIFYITLYFTLALSSGKFEKKVGKGIKVRIDNAKKLMYHVYKGKITPIQSAWIFGYVCYRLLISSNYFLIQIPLDMIITIGFVMALSLTNKRIRTPIEMLKEIVVMPTLDKIMEGLNEEEEKKIRTIVLRRRPQ